MENPETLRTLGTHDTGRRQTKQKTQQRTLNRLASRTQSGNNLRTVDTEFEIYDCITYIKWYQMYISLPDTDDLKIIRFH